MTIKIALIDDQTLVRQGIKGLLALSDKVTVVAEGADGEEAVDLCQRAQPDVVLMDIRMPRVNGIDAIKRLSAAGVTIPVIILTTFDDHELVLQGISAGAKGYLLKDVSLESLIDAIVSVASGQTMIKPAITETLLRGLTKQEPQYSADAASEPLTPKETEILRLMAGGYSNKEISTALHKSSGTIKNHVSNILAKMDVRDRTRAVLKALEQGLI